LFSRAELVNTQHRRIDVHQTGRVVRVDKLGPGKQGDGQGHVGNPAKATALFGKRILEMQIEDATAQIRELRVSSRRR